MTGNRTIERLLRQQAALAKFGSFAFGEPDLQKVLSEAARICAESLNVPYSKICHYRPNEDDLLVVAGYGWEPGVKRKYPDVRIIAMSSGGRSGSEDLLNMAKKVGAHGALKKPFPPADLIDKIKEVQEGNGL